MSGTPAARPGGRATRLRLAVIAVLAVAVVLGGVAMYSARRHPRPVGHAAAAVADPAPSVSLQASTATPAQASGGPAASSATTVPPATGRSPARPDSDVDPDAVFVDPAAAAPRTETPVAAGPPRCADWRKRMTAQKRTEYSAALLRAAWQNEGDSATPPDATIRAFAAAISDACAGRSAANGLVADVARTVFVSDPKTWGP